MIQGLCPDLLLLGRLGTDGADGATRDFRPPLLGGRNGIAGSFSVERGPRLAVDFNDSEASSEALVPARRSFSNSRASNRFQSSKLMFKFSMNSCKQRGDHGQ